MAKTRQSCFLEMNYPEFKYRNTDWLLSAGVRAGYVLYMAESGVRERGTGKQRGIGETTVSASLYLRFCLIVWNFTFSGGRKRYVYTISMHKIGM